MEKRREIEKIAKKTRSLLIVASKGKEKVVYVKGAHKPSTQEKLPELAVDRVKFLNPETSLIKDLSDLCLDFDSPSLLVQLQCFLEQDWEYCAKALADEWALEIFGLHVNLDRPKRSFFREKDLELVSSDSSAAIFRKGRKFFIEPCFISLSLLCRVFKRSGVPIVSYSHCPKGLKTTSGLLFLYQFKTALSVFPRQ